MGGLAKELGLKIGLWLYLVVSETDLFSTLPSTRSRTSRDELAGRGDSPASALPVTSLPFPHSCRMADAPKLPFHGFGPGSVGVS